MQPDSTHPKQDANEALFEIENQAGSVGKARATRSRKPARKPSQSVRTSAEVGEPRLNPADELEIRLARMQYFNGSYTRRGINLERHFDHEPLLVTDLDLLSFDVTSRLTLSKTIGEAKSGTGKNAPKPLDRAIWIAGLRQLVGADAAIIVTALRPSAHVRDTVRGLGILAMSVDELNRWEKTHLARDLEDVGAHGPSAFAADAFTRATVKGEPRLERIYWFLRSEVWFLDSWQASKRLIGALGELRGYWTAEVEDDQAAALRWIYAETISILTLQLVALVGRYRAFDLRDWAGYASDRLAEGPVPANNQRALADSFDKYLAHILGELKAPAAMSIETMGAFHPTPPDWAESLIELVSRLEVFPGLAELPRQTDLVVTERLVRRRHVSSEALAAVSCRDPDEFGRMRRQIAAFLRGAIDLPEAVDKALSA